MLDGNEPAPVVVESPWVPNVGANADVVVVNPRWMNEISEQICGGRAECEQDLIVGIAAHEWGHVLDARRRPHSEHSGHERELAADRTAGRVLAHRGASPRPLLRLLREEAAEETSTHPAGEQRAEAVLAGHEGWGACQGEGRCSCEDC